MNINKINNGTNNISIYKDARKKVFDSAFFNNFNTTPIIRFKMSNAG